MLELICKELGVEIGEEWGVEWVNDKKFSNDKKFLNYTKFKFTKTSLMGYRKDFESWFTGDFLLSDLIYGKVKPIWIPKDDQRYYSPAIDSYLKFASYCWAGNTRDNLLLERGLVFKTSEEAINCANKILEEVEKC